MRATIETPDGTYALDAQWLLACDGAKSPVRGMLGLDFIGRIFEERFLIADVEMKGDFPLRALVLVRTTHFHGGQSALFHKQPDDIYRIDLQLGWDADPEHENQPEVVIPRIRPWSATSRSNSTGSPSTPSMPAAGAVHPRPGHLRRRRRPCGLPFGARGGNSGIQDVDNLCWKLAAHLKGEAPLALVESYEAERIHGADENIKNSARSTTFMTPKSPMERMFRDETLDLAADHEFARRMVNSGGSRSHARSGSFPLPDAG